MTTAYTTDSRFALHTAAAHPEHAGRLDAIEQALAVAGLPDRLLHIAPRMPTAEDLLAVHTRDYLARLEATRGRPPARLDPETYVTPHSDEVARLAAGAVLALTDAVLGGAAANGLAAVRPPGHHATPTRAMGFCLLNNVAIAARYAQRQYRVERVAIVDVDVHHGNGVQEIFYADPSVLYVSTHQSPLYPGTGAVFETGAGAGQGATVNVPLPPGVGDTGYRAALDRVIALALRRFAPEVLFVSMGFDAHWADPLAQMALSLTGYDALTRKLVELAAELCAGRLIVVLEGGYYLPALAAGWSNAVRALLGDPECADPLGPARGAEPEISSLLERVHAVHNLP